MTPALRTEKLSLSTRLLVHTDLSIAPLADELGFDNATNVNKFFKREVDCTPAEFGNGQESSISNTDITLVNYSKQLSLYNN